MRTVAMGGAAFTDDIPIAALEMPAAELVFKGNVIYEATAKVQMAWELYQASTIERYAYTADSVLNGFDPAYAAAQASYNNPASVDADFLAAKNALKAAIDGLVDATFYLIKKSLLAKIGKLQYVGDLVGDVIFYDGLGMIVPTSNNPTICDAAIDPVKGWMLVLYKAGIATFSFNVEGTNLYASGLAVSVS